MANPRYMTMRDKAVLSQARGSRERFGFALSRRDERIADGWKAYLAAACMKYPSGFSSRWAKKAVRPAGQAPMTVSIGKLVLGSCESVILGPSE
jgi:hypothetical protein